MSKTETKGLDIINTLQYLIIHKIHVSEPVRLWFDLMNPQKSSDTSPYFTQFA
jgi:hypothetical protein